MLVLAALSFALHLSERPTGLVLPGEELAYGSFLKGEAVAAAGLLSGRTCASFEISSVSSRTITISQGSVPAANERVVLEGCGIRHVQNVEVARFGSTPEWRARLGVVGESLTNSGQQRLFMPDMFGFARLAANVSCDDSFLVLDTYVAATPGNVTFSTENYSAANSDQPSVAYDQAVSDVADVASLAQSWAEVWKLRICNRDHTDLIIFIPMPDGSLSTKYVNISEVPVADLPKRAIPAVDGQGTPI